MLIKATTKELGRYGLCLCLEGEFKKDFILEGLKLATPLLFQGLDSDGIKPGDMGRAVYIVENETNAANLYNRFRETFKSRTDLEFVFYS